MIRSEKKLEILYDHYKDTFLQIRIYISQREKFFFYLLIALGIIVTQVGDTSLAREIVESILEKNIPKVKIPQINISILIDFLTLSLSIRYYQLNIQIERQWDYLHDLERRLKKLSRDSLIEREGKSYLNNYPFIKSIIHRFYTIGFPVFFIVILSSYAYIIVFPTLLNFYSILETTILSTTILIAILYIIHINKKDIDKILRYFRGKSIKTLSKTKNSCE